MAYGGAGLGAGEEEILDPFLDMYHFLRMSKTLILQ